MNLRDLLLSIGADPVRAQEVAGRVEDARPWFVQVALAFGVWLGSAVIAVAIFILPGGNEIATSGGVLAIVVGAIVSRLSQGVVGNHVGFVGGVVGSVLLVVGLADWFSLSETSAAWLLATISVVVFLAIPLKPLRFLAVVTFVCSPLIADDDLVDALVWSLCVATTLLWIFERRLLASVVGPALTPVLYALPALLIVLIAPSGPRVFILSEFEFGGAWPIVDAVLLGGMLLLTLAIAAQETQAPMRIVIVAGSALVILAALTHQVPGLMAAALVMALGRHRKARLLEGLGSVAAAVFVWRLYYSLEVTFLVKSAVILASGALILLVRIVLLGLAGGQDPLLVMAGSFLRPFGDKGERRKDALGPAVVVVALMIGLVLHKESIRHDGRVVLLQLAPVDPRSLLQGDYMRLRYRVARNLPKGVERGVAVLAIDNNGVGSFRRLDRGEPLLPNEVRLRFHSVDGQGQLGAESFFFEEGRAEVFASARYAELRVSDAGTSLLIGLLTEDRQPIR